MTWFDSKDFIVDEYTVLRLISHIENPTGISTPTIEKLATHPNFSILSKNEMFRNKLKNFLQESVEYNRLVGSKKTPKDLSLLHDKLKVLWTEYEMLRRLVAWNNNSLNVFRIQ